ncbi:putative quinol monooxygenase [Flavobacterium sp. SLB02]|uniref:putative quinol monooxygenase n=1 Tax=Flavobacterium sp. SLB02 TaxID=2665645 RepID=UPI0012A936F2|nr:putative quinol monooxygenase [Flavobacterium sp. SLB02]QGK74288.1 antibiotic biosynthesis monooxygenase [Flavobacterium sp. SLB02]
MENQNPVHVFATWKVKEGQIENVLNLLKTVHDESVQEKGNLFYTVHQSNSDLNTILLFEGYTSEAAVTTHRNSSYFQEIVLGQIVPLLESREIMLATPLDYLKK